MHRALAAFLLVPLLASCGHPWPREARGGMAERDEVTEPALRSMRDAIALRAAHPGPVGTGPVAEAGELYVRAVREDAAGLKQDADRTLLKASMTLGGADRLRDDGPVCLKAPCR